jgi:hypothetical protein
MTLELLQEYNANKPFILHMRRLEQLLADAKEEIHKGREELEMERLWNKLKEQHTWEISVDELNNASIGLGLSPLHNFDKIPSLSGSDLKKWVMDVFYHPSKYVEVIRQMRDIYNSQYKSTTASTN